MRLSVSCFVGHHVFPARGCKSYKKADSSQRLAKGKALAAPEHPDDANVNKNP